MRSIETTTINGAWSQEANAWVSDVVHLTGDCYIEATLPGKGRLVIKKSESAEGPFPKALISKWSGPDFKILVYGTTKGRYLKICLTDIPTTIQYVMI